MTDITRLFHVSTRGFTGMERKYSGQIYDAQSTTLHFEYDPVDFLKNTGDGEYWIPYIQFAVYDAKGNPLTYGPDPKTSQPTFDGYTFEIPYDVTSRARTQRVEYQLFFVKNTVSYDPKRDNVAQLDRADYLLSAIDGIAIKPSITCKPTSRKTCCPPLGPQSEPSIVGYIDIWKKYGLVVPVECDFDAEKDAVKFMFHTYEGTNDFTLYMDRLPYLDEDRVIPSKFLPFIKTWADDEVIDDIHIPTALLVKSSIDDLEARKTDKVMAIVYWNEEWEYSKGSTVIGTDDRSQENIYISKKNNNIGHPVSDTEYWSCVVEYDVIVNGWEVAKVDNVPSTIMVKERFERNEADIANLYEIKVDKESIDTAWQDEPSDERIPSSKLVKATTDDLDARKTDKTMAIPEWDSSAEYNYQSVVVWEDELYISLKDNNIGHQPSLENTEYWSTIVEYENITTVWNAEPTDKMVPSEKLVKDTLDSKVDDVQIINEWSSEPQEDKIPSEKLVSDTVARVQSEIDDLVDSVVENKREITTLKARVDGHDTKLNDIKTWQTAVDQRITVIEGELSNKTPVELAIFPWSETRTYGMDSTVIYNSILYISIAENNTGNNPEETIDTFWTEISGSGGGSASSVSAKTIIFGNTTDTDYVLRHGLNTYDFLWSLRTNDDYRRYVIADIFAYDRMNVKVSLTSPPGDNAFVINLVGTKSPSAQSNVQVVEVTTPSTEWMYDNTSGLPIYVQTYDSSGNEITANVKQISTDGFTPVYMQYNDAKAGTMLVSASAQYYQFENTATWVIPHSLGKYVLAQAFTDAQGNIMGDVSQDGNSVVFMFSQPLSGFIALVIPDHDAIFFENQNVWTFTHNKGRLIQVQTYDETGDHISGDIQCNEVFVTVTFSEPKTGYLVYN